jgi:F0F1-type ATP synthase membrane subunit b/b'
MGAVSDIFGNLRYGFMLATSFAMLLFLGMFYNWLANPVRDVLRRTDASEYGVSQESTE